MRLAEHLDLGPPGGRAAAQTVLFLHGLEGGAESWRYQLDALSPMVRCVAWTMPGYGRSRSLAETTVEALADAARDLLDHLGITQAVVVGQSLGGCVAQELALRHPERVERLVLVATAAVFGHGPGAAYTKGLVAARLLPLDDGGRMADLARAVIPSLVGPDCPGSVVSAMVKVMAAIPAASYRAAVDAMADWDGRDRVSALAVATLCLAGGLDTTTPPTMVADLAARIPGARAEVVDGAGHLVAQERPDEVNRLLRSFLAWM